MTTAATEVTATPRATAARTTVPAVRPKDVWRVDLIRIPLLTTHLTFAEIGERLFVSATP